MGRTTITAAKATELLNFNSLAPCGANPLRICLISGGSPFQLTRPVWGEPAAAIINIDATAISTHSPRVGRTDQTYLTSHDRYISTHSPRVGRTDLLLVDLLDPQRFQLTRPVWGEPWKGEIEDLTAQISTHSPRVGRTRASRSSKRCKANFNSLAPCGANQPIAQRCQHTTLFQLTRPVWGEPQFWIA